MVSGSREGGKAKPLKQGKKDAKVVDDEDLALRNKQRADEKAKKEMAAKVGKGPLSAGLKKSSGSKK